MSESAAPPPDRAERNQEPSRREVIKLGAVAGSAAAALGNAGKL